MNHNLLTVLLKLCGTAMFLASSSALDWAGKVFLSETNSPCQDSMPGPWTTLKSLQRPQCTLPLSRRLELVMLISSYLVSINRAYGVLLGL